MYTKLVSRSQLDFGLSLDRELAERTRNGGCQHCAGPLHVANFPRQGHGLPHPRRRHDRTRLSFCCGQDACRHRATPPSVRFFGRRSLLASLFLLVCSMRDRRRTAELCMQLEIDRRTLQRWRSWWCHEFVRTRVWGALRGLVPGEVDPGELPRVLLEHYGGLRPRPIRDLLRQLCPLTTETDSTHDP